MRRINTSELRREPVLCDPAAVCRALGIDRLKRRQARGLMVCCPAHDDRNPSCSVTRGDDGTLRVKCFGCDFTADAIGFAQKVRGIDFRGAVEELARLAGRWDLLADSRAGHGSSSWRPTAPLQTPSLPVSNPIAVQLRRPKPEEVDELWAKSREVAADSEAVAMLRARALDVARIDELQLARVIPGGLTLPWWARCQGKTWLQSAHRLICPVYDARGIRRSLRAWCLRTGAREKRLAPARQSVAGLVLADPFAQAMLIEGKWSDGRPITELVICEGESDFLTWAARFSDADEAAPIFLGVVSGAWTEEVASRVPDGAKVAVRTDHDDAGEKYYKSIRRSLAPRCRVKRSEPFFAEAA